MGCRQEVVGELPGSPCRGDAPPRYIRLDIWPSERQGNPSTRGNQATPVVTWLRSWEHIEGSMGFGVIESRSRSRAECARLWHPGTRPCTMNAPAFTPAGIIPPPRGARAMSGRIPGCAWEQAADFIQHRAGLWKPWRKRPRRASAVIRGRIDALNIIVAPGHSGRIPPVLHLLHCGKMGGTLTQGQEHR